MSDNINVPTGEAVNIEAARANLAAIGRVAENTVTTIDTLVATLAGHNLDSHTLNEVAAILDAAMAVQAAAAAALNGLNSRHTVMEEAVNATPEAANTDFYRH